MSGLPPPGTIQVWSDLLCPFALIGLVRLRRARASLGVEVALEHRTFPLELFDGPHRRRGTDSEAAALGVVEPAAKLRLWTAPDDRYPHTVLLAAEAVHAAGGQGAGPAEELDLALRTAFWTHSRSIAHRAVILDVAGEVPDLDVDALADAIDGGTHRRAVMADFAAARSGAIGGSPTFRLPDGSAVSNPGMSVRWEGEFAVGFPVVDADDATVYDDLLNRAAG